MTTPTSFPLASATGLLALFEQALLRDLPALSVEQIADLAGRLARAAHTCRGEIETLALRQEAAFLAQLLEASQ